MTFSQEPPFQICLTGRTRWIGVCHEEPGMCASCLRAVARFLARESGYNLRCALDWPVGAYAEQIGITDKQGAELRRMTVLECFLHGTDVGGFAPGATARDVLIADELVLPSRVPMERAA